jgi:pimeloyl-ACP methyl ester carboxylesterase
MWLKRGPTISFGANPARNAEVCMECQVRDITFHFDPDTLPSPFWAPALFLTGRQDSWCGYRGAFRILDNYPRATYAVLDRAAHALAMEQRTLFRNLVSEWLDRVEEFAPAA